MSKRAYIRGEACIQGAYIWDLSVLPMLEVGLSNLCSDPNYLCKCKNISVLANI